MRFCYIFFCTKKKKKKYRTFRHERIFSLFQTRKTFLHIRPTFVDIFFFYFTKIVIIIYIFFFLSNFSPPKTNKTMNEGHEMILRFYFSLLRESAVFMHNFFSFFPLFFESRNTLLDAAFHNDPNSVEKRILSIDASEIPGKISRTALNLARHVCAEERKTVNSDVTSSHVFIRETFRSLSSKNRTSFFRTSIDLRIVQKDRPSGKREGKKGESRNEEDADLSYAWPHLRLVRGYILPPESFPPAARKLVARFHPRFLPLHPNQP